MRAAKKPVEYLPKPFSFTTIPKKSVSYIDNAEEFQDKIMTQKWDLHRQIKESLAVLDPQSARDRSQSENDQSLANMGSTDRFEVEEATESELSQLKKLIVRRQLRVFGKIVRVLAGKHTKKRAAQYFYEQRLRRRCFDVLKMPDQQLAALANKCTALIQHLRAGQSIARLRKGLSQEPTAKQLTEYLWKSRLKAAIKKLQTNKTDSAERSITADYLALLTKTLATKRMMRRMAFNQTANAGYQDNVSSIKKIILSKAVSTFKSGYQHLRHENKQKKLQQLQRILKASHLRRLQSNSVQRTEWQSNATSHRRRRQTSAVAGDIIRTKRQTLEVLLKRNRQQQLLMSLHYSALQTKRKKIEESFIVNQATLLFEGLASHYDDRLLASELQRRLEVNKKRQALKRLNDYRRQSLTDKFQFNILFFRRLQLAQRKAFDCLKSKQLLKEAEHELTEGLQKRSDHRRLLIAFNAIKIYQDNPSSSEDSEIASARNGPRYFNSIESNHNRSQSERQALEEESRSDFAESLAPSQSVPARRRLPDKPLLPGQRFKRAVEKDEHPFFEKDISGATSKLMLWQKKRFVESLLNHLEEDCLYNRKRLELKQLRKWTYLQQLKSNLTKFNAEHKRQRQLQQKKEVLSELLFDEIDLKKDNEDVELEEEQRSHKQLVVPEDQVEEDLNLSEESLSASGVSAVLQQLHLLSLVKSHIESKAVLENERRLQVERLKIYGKILLKRLADQLSASRKCVNLQRSIDRRRTKQTFSQLADFTTANTSLQQRQSLVRVIRLTGASRLFRQQILSRLNNQKKLKEATSKLIKLRIHRYQSTFIRQVAENKTSNHQEDVAKKLQGRLKALGKMYFIQRLKQLRSIGTFNKAILKGAESLLPWAFQQLKFKSGSQVRLAEEEDRKAQLLYKKAFITKLARCNQQRKSTKERQQQLTTLLKSLSIKRALKNLVEVVRGNRDHHQNQLVLALAHQKRQGQLALLRMRDYKDSKEIQRLREKRNEQMSKYADARHLQGLKRNSFMELKRLFLESQNTRNAALLTKCLQGWRNIHVQNLLLTKYLVEFERVSYYPQSAEEREQFERLKQ